MTGIVPVFASPRDLAARLLGMIAGFLDVEQILGSAKIIRVIKLHRSTFPSIDTFPVIIELERCADAVARDANFYQFYDLAQFHPQTDKTSLADAYAAILADLDASGTWPFADDLAKRYQVRQGMIGQYANNPIFEGRPSLFEFMANVTAKPVDLKLPAGQGQFVHARARTVRGRHVVMLSDIAAAKFGLQSGDNPRFFRTAPGTTGGAAKGGYKVVNIPQAIDDAGLAALTSSEKSSGIIVNDPTADRFWVPLDKAGAADIEKGLFAEYWRPVEFYVDWSEQAVSAMQHHKSAVFRNPQYYFRRGISFSNTGIYSPSFRLGHGGVFDQTGSNIFCDVMEREVLLGILSSKLLRYFGKSFINHGVHAEVDDLPIVMPNAEQVKSIKALVDRIVKEQQADLAFDYRMIASQIDDVVDDLYGLTDDERLEVRSWHRRHYPKLN